MEAIERRTQAQRDVDPIPNTFGRSRVESGEHGRIFEKATGGHHAANSGRRNDSFDIGEGLDVAVGDDRNADGIVDEFHGFQVDRIGSLVFRSAVNGDETGAGGLDLSTQIHGSLNVAVDPNFDRNGEIVSSDSIASSFHDVGYELGFVDETRSDAFLQRPTLGTTAV